MAKRVISEYLPSALNLISGGIVLFVSFLVDLRFPISSNLAKLSGMIIVAVGMSLVVWAALHLRGAFLGEVEPTLDRLVQSGPYHCIRHPVYLGMTVALSGVAISLRSWLGFILVFFLFLPSEVYRAMQEEKSLSRRFGAEWDEYTLRTGFLLPFVI